MKSQYLFLSCFILFSVHGISQDTKEALRKKQFNLSGGVAISGYDPVAYQAQNKAIKGNAKISFDYQGVIYYFTSEVNRTLFEKAPEAYEPQYGGWCAYAMGSTGEKVEVDPETFKVLNGKLYLFYNKFFNNTLKSWNKDEANLKSKAGINWSKIFK